MYYVPRRLFEETFDCFQRCGRGLRECQALWLSAWDDETRISRVVHPMHAAGLGHFQLDDGWLTRFWLQLADWKAGVRIQVHTHPGEAFHSPTDDEYPIIHSVGFYSLVIPNYGLGPADLSDAFLVRRAEDGLWHEVEISAHIKII